MLLKDIKVGLGITGSFCNFGKLEKIINRLKEEGAIVYPIASYNVLKEENRFSTPKKIKEELEHLTENEIIDTISKAEPIGPKSLIDIMVILPCTGNTIAKLAQGITDTPVLMATKSHLRNNKAVVIAVSTNDALSGNASNIGMLLNRKNYYFVPFSQDDSKTKPFSMVFNEEKVVDTICLALEGKQIQPIIA